MLLTTALLAAAFVYGVLSDNNCPISEKSIYEPSVFQKCIYNSRNEKTSYNNSEMFCRSANGFLLKINNGYENRLAVSILNEENGDSAQSVRLGLRRTNNVWSWDDVSAATYLHFAPGHPKSGMNCASLNTADLLWYSTDCQVPSSFSCLFPRLNNPTTAPTKCKGCLPGWYYFVKSNACYFVGHNANYTEASNVCAALGASLTSIHSPDENNIIIALTYAIGDPQCGGPEKSFTWIGGYYSDQWRWADGTAFDYNNLYAHSGNSGNLVMLTYSAMDNFGQWNNYPPDTQLAYFICKTPAS